MPRPHPFIAMLSLLLVAGLSIASQPVKAQAEPQHGAAAEAWLSEALKEQQQKDLFGRYVAAPAGVLVAGGALLLPAVVPSAASSSIAYVSSGALMLTAAIGVWAHPDAYEAQRWYALFGALGFTAFGTGLVLSCLERDDVCSDHAVTRRMQIGLGALEAGAFLSGAITALILPPPSPTALELSVRNLGGADRQARVLEFLERRDQVRRVSAYVSAPWGMALGGLFLGSAHDAVTTGGQVFMYSAGAVLLALNLGALLYEQLRKPDADRLRAGEYP